MSLKLLISTVFAFICASMLCGVPDPDLFDGRFSAIKSNASGAGNGIDKDGKGSESGGVVEVDDGGKSSSEVVSEETTATDGEMSGSGKSESVSSSPAEAATSVTGSGRSFEEFEIGAIDQVNGKIEVNQSKDFGEPSSSVFKPNSAANSNMQNSDKSAPQNDSGNQEAFDGDSAADYGTNVPSGL